MVRSSIILEAIGKSYSILQSNQKLKKSIPLILELLGKATDVDRVYVFKNYHDSHYGLCTSFIYEWYSPSVNSHIDIEYFKNLQWSIFPQAKKDLLKNRSVNGLLSNIKNYEFHKTMAELGVMSYQFVPIFSGGAFWGFLGFDNCRSEELFSQQLVSALQAFASTLGSIILEKKQKKELIKSKKSYFDLVNSIRDVIFKIDRHGNWFFLNNAWVSISGYQIKETIGKCFFDFFDPLLRVEIISEIDELLTGVKEESEVELRLLTKDNQLVWVKAHINLLRGPQERIAGVSGTLININNEKSTLLALKKSEDNLQRLNKLLQAVNDTQLSFFIEDDFQNLLRALRDNVFNISKSSFVFIGEVLYDDNGSPYLLCHTISDTSWSEEMNEFYLQDFEAGIATHNLGSLLDQSLNTEKLVISNNVSLNTTSGPAPITESGVFRYIGIPVHKGGDFLGMMGFGNSFMDYSPEDADFLQPLVLGYANFIKAIRINRINKESDLLRRKADENFKLISENTHDIIALHGLDFRFEFISPSIERLLGHKPEDLIGRLPSEIFGNRADTSFGLIEEPFKIVKEHHHKTTNNAVFLEIILTPLKDENGKVYSILAISRDVTDREKMLEELKISLAKEKELNQLKSRFISMTSHEFRTPLATIMSSTELLGMILRRSEAGDLITMSETHISRINAQVKRLTAVISDLLILEKSSQNKIVFTQQEILINRFVKNIVDNHISDMGSKINTDISEEDIIIHTDPTWLSHIIYNLIENAIKYSVNSDQCPEVILEKCEKNILIKVKDYGIGIPQSDQKYIFGSFFRGENVSNIKGTGLGLNIVKEFINKLGGDISFVSQEGKGSVFTLKLPYEN